MVSLSDDARRSGGYFFTDDQSSVQVSDSDERLLTNEAFSGEKDLPFRRIKTTWAIVTEILLLVVLVGAIFVIPVICTGSTCKTDAAAIIVYIHGGLWFLLLLLDYYLRKQHHISRLYGYLEFFRRTKDIRRVAFVVCSGACAVLLIAVKLLDEYCTMNGRHVCGTLKDENYLQMIITVEVVLILPFLVMYLVRTINFNKQEACPDVNQDEMLTSFIQSQSHSDVGFRDENYVDEILEKQADMLRYLKQHNAQLGRRILTLTAENLAMRERR